MNKKAILYGVIGAAILIVVANKVPAIRNVLIRRARSIIFFSGLKFQNQILFKFYKG